MTIRFISFLWTLNLYIAVLTIFVSAKKCCDESILLPTGETEFNILNCYMCLNCYDSSHKPYDLSVLWYDEQGHQGEASENDGLTYEIKLSEDRDPGLYTFTVTYAYTCGNDFPILLSLEAQKLLYVYGANISHYEDENNDIYIECVTGLGVNNDNITLDISLNFTNTAPSSTMCSAECIDNQCVWNDAMWVNGVCTVKIENPSSTESGTYCCTVSNEMNQQLTDCDKVTSSPATKSPAPHNNHNSSDNSNVAVAIGSIIGLLLLIAVIVIASIAIYWWINHRNQQLVPGDGNGGDDAPIIYGEPGGGLDDTL